MLDVRPGLQPPQTDRPPPVAAEALVPHGRHTLPRRADRFPAQPVARPDGLALRLEDAVARRARRPTLSRCPVDFVAQLPDEPRSLVLADLDPLSFLRERLVSRENNARIVAETRARCGLEVATLARILGTVETDVLREMTMGQVWRALRPYARALSVLPDSIVAFRAHRVESLPFAVHRILCAKRLECVIQWAKVDERLITENGDVSGVTPGFQSTTLKKLHAYHLGQSGQAAANDRIRRLLTGLIARQLSRIARLERGDCVTISELFHDTEYRSAFQSILLGSIDPRMGRDKKPYKGAYVSDTPGSYAHLTFGFAADLVDTRPYWDEPVEQKMGYWGFVDRLEVNPVRAQIFDRFAHAVCAAAVGGAPGSQRYMDLFNALTSAFVLTRSEGRWAIMMPEWDRELPSEYFLCNHIKKICEGITKEQAARGAKAGWTAIEALADVPDTSGAVTANVSAPAREDLGLWAAQLSFEDIAAHLRTQGILMLGDLIDHASQLVELEYLRKDS